MTEGSTVTVVSQLHAIYNESIDHYISQTPFEIYETTNGRNSPVSASNHFLTHRRGRSPIKAKGAWVYPQGPGTYVSWSRDALVAFFLVLQTIR